MRSWRLKSFLFLAIILGCGWSLRLPAQMMQFAFWRSQNTMFTWLAGSSTQTMSGLYGALGTGAAANFPGERSGACSFTDSSGNLWLFGGYGFDANGNSSILNDLWKYTPGTGYWTWVNGNNNVYQNGVYGTKGTGSTTNYPGTRSDASCWIDSSDNLWIFGGNGLDSVGTWGAMNDLWKYTPSSAKWTWVHGSNVSSGSPTYGTKGTATASTVPGARWNAATWVISGTVLYLFGGWAKDSAGTYNQINDMWKFDTSTSKWTWISGANTVLQAGTYGTKGTGSTSNIPGARSDLQGNWTDASGNLWLFGGNGIDSVGAGGQLNDMWKFNPTSLQWTWVSGAATYGAVGTYGTQGTGSTSNTPGARMSHRNLKDSSGIFWLSGGFGKDVNSNIGDLNDVWKFDPSSSQWTWMSGAQIYYAVSVYGTKGIGSTSNIIGAREKHAAWADSTGNLWFSGGYGEDGVGAGGFANDLWKYTPSSGNWAWMAGPYGNLQAPSYGTKGTASSTNYPGARGLPVAWRDSTGILWMFGGQGVDFSGGFSVLNDLWKYNVSTAQWTWVSGLNTVNGTATYGTKGTAAAANVPSARMQPMGWADSSANLWMFGGYDITQSPGFFNDLWKYNTSTGQWTWMSGASAIDGAATYGTKGTAAAANVPGARASGATWIDSSGNLWLFGGFGHDSAGTVDYLNDLWKYNASSGQWTWIAGSNVVDQGGTYGTKGTGSTSNIPGARYESFTWTDSGGNFWLFGGYGYLTTSAAYGFLSDLWKFDPIALKWTWVSGSSTAVSSAGVYGSINVPAPGNIPGARTGSTSWRDTYGNLWLFGGLGADTNSNINNLNDLWKFNIGTGQWTWVRGSNTGASAGVYGTKGVAAAANIPGSRQQTAIWSNGAGTAWFFGGLGVDPVSNYGSTGEFWKFGP